MPVGYFHVVFTLPAPIADIAYHNKAVIYDLLFKASAETVLTIAADPKHLGAHIGITAVLHTWGSQQRVRYVRPELRLLERHRHRSGRDTVDHGRIGSDDYLAPPRAGFPNSV